MYLFINSNCFHNFFQKLIYQDPEYQVYSLKGYVLTQLQNVKDLN